MKNLILTAVLHSLIFAGQAMASTVFINEIHYDNDGADIDEAIEIAGPAGTDLIGWSLVLYNGSDGAAYHTEDLSFGVIPDQGGGYGTLAFAIVGIQNGAPDGVALVDNFGLVEFVSYEGGFMATDGPATGFMSMDIGVAEDGLTPAGFSLQRIGVGSDSEDFSWIAPSVSSFGAVNFGQAFSAVPESTSLLFVGSGLVGLLALRRRYKESVCHRGLCGGIVQGLSE